MMIVLDFEQYVRTGYRIPPRGDFLRCLFPLPSDAVALSFLFRQSSGAGAAAK